MLRHVAPVALIVVFAACSDDTDTRTFSLEHLEPGTAMQMIEPYVPRGLSNISVTHRDSGATTSTITVTAPPVRLEQISDLLDQYDRELDVQLRFQIIEADGFTGTDPAIADVQQALGELFRFRGYRLSAEALVQARARGFVQQRTVGADGTAYLINATVDRVMVGDSGTAAALSVELVSEEGGTLLQTSLTVPSGQTVVVGSARARTGANTVILVVRPLVQ